MSKIDFLDSLEADKFARNEGFRFFYSLCSLELPYLKDWGKLECLPQQFLKKILHEKVVGMYSTRSWDEHFVVKMSFFVVRMYFFRKGRPKKNHHFTFWLIFLDPKNRITNRFHLIKIEINAQILNTESFLCDLRGLRY